MPRSFFGQDLLQAGRRLPRIAARLAVIPGLVEHGLFLGETVERVIVADGSGVRELLHGS